MPPVSEAQRRAMWAAAEGHSTLGIPQSVGRKFVRDDASVDTGSTAASHLAEHERLSNAPRD